MSNTEQPLPMPMVAFGEDHTVPIGAGLRVSMSRATPDDLWTWLEAETHDLGRRWATATGPEADELLTMYVGVARYVASRLRAWIDHPQCATLGELEHALGEEVK